MGEKYHHLDNGVSFCAPKVWLHRVKAEIPSGNLNGLMAKPIEGLNTLLLSITNGDDELPPMGITTWAMGANVTILISG
jgi:hypothetical protein